MRFRKLIRIFVLTVTVLSIATSAVAQQSGAGKNLRFSAGGGNTGSVVAIPDSASLDITNAITLEAWVRRLDGAGGANRIFTKSSEVYTLRIGTGPGDQNVQFILNPTSGSAVATTGEIVSGFAGKWFHLAATWDGNGDRLMRIYINGRESNYGFQATVNPPLDNGTTELWLSHWAESFQGFIDHARLWNVARTPTQIRDWMHKTENLNLETGLVSVWNFNEGSGTTTADLLGLNNGTLYSCDRLGSPGCTGNLNAPQWMNSTAPFSAKGAYVGATNIPTSAGPTGGSITANITSPASVSDHLGIYQFGSPTGSFVSAGDFDSFAVYGVTQRSNIIWGAYEKGSVISNLTFDYSQVTGISNPSQVKLLRRTDSSDWSWDYVPESSRNDTARTLTLNSQQDFYEYALGFNFFTPPCASVPVDLVSWWQLEWNFTSATMPDARGANDGTLSNGAGNGPGAVGLAVGYSFTTSITVPDNPSLDFTANQDFTLEAFIKTTQLGSTRRMIIDKRSTTTPRGYALYLLNGRPQLDLLDGVTNTYGGFGNDLRDGNWHHLVVSIDRNNPSGGIRFFVDGVQIGTTTVSVNNGDLSSDGAFFIGRNNVQDGTTNFVGTIDEVGIYNRALFATEATAIFNSQQTGKCRPTATNAPANLIGWWAGDGDANDTSVTGNNGTFQGAEKFDIGRSGQSFFFDGASYVDIPHHAGYDTMTTSFSIESWIKSNGFVGNDDTIISKGTNTWRVQRRPGTSSLRFSTNHVGGAQDLDSSINVTDGAWHHVVAVFRPGGAKSIWIDGVLSASVTFNSPLLTNNANIWIGDNSQAPGRFFNGHIDEATIYERGLTDNEIRALHKAGLAGKLKNEITALGFGMYPEFETSDPDPKIKTERSVTPQATTVTIGDATITFASVTTAGVTQSIPLDPATQPPLQVGRQHTGLVYDISTTAVYSGNVSLCFKLPAFANLSSSEFNERIIVHLESGIWANRTVSHDFTNKIICAQTTSLSPFAIVDGLSPTAATVSVSGRVFTPSGAGLRNAVVTLTDSNGVAVSARTASFGYYRFDNVEVGQTYVVSVASKRFTFTPRVISVTDELTDLDFVADSPE
jgi:hypothetical protein